MVDKKEVVTEKSSIRECPGCIGFKGNSQSAKYQDEKYGFERRVHTFSEKGHPRCTVCGKEKS